MDEAAFNKERSLLRTKHANELKELEKDVKKKKGAMKEAAQKKLEDAEERHAKELAEFDKQRGGGGGKPSAASASASSSSSSKDQPKNGTASSSSSSAALAMKVFPDANWSGLSNSELQAACEERGISKKGKKEDLISRLMQFHQSQAARLREQEGGGQGQQQQQQASRAAGGDENGGMDKDDDDDDPKSQAEIEESERQYKRELVMRKALRAVLNKHAQKLAADGVTEDPGIPIDELCERFAAIKVRNFRPELLGYTTVEEFVDSQPDGLVFYDKKAKRLYPPEEGDDDDEDDDD
ncbi:unnamed protein product [Vitrella brassicaformis CCMP3155]|uniref:SAP domain-containing protein n=1 Tax=Vitrella brassicaformis (strain CCMP3155) TaxID=1169540 RepID=A0A0G4EQ67_VITBC|nr:unnamed protein product [Vitrella brassicaformis CCMP3155]|eukprot:CEL99431.1 unnamed protein product [Vitrella brassicaformis CCMP3155]